MPNQFFRFKQFIVRQEGSAMKVGTDGVLLGAWTSIGDAKRILDVGTGTGLIALMLAQRSNALIDAVEIDENSALQAINNVNTSRWGERVNIYNKSFQDYANETNHIYDLIVSNPPYFVNSLKSEEVARMVARHNEQLPHSDLLKGITNLLAENGRFVGIFPYVEGNIFVAEASKYELYCNKRVSIHGKVNGPVKRLMLDFGKQKMPLEESVIAIRGVDAEYTPDYISLTKDFYLAF
jgi:tRNA1Val (adenine37-N6)-methyltransferase